VARLLGVRRPVPDASVLIGFVKPPASDPSLAALSGRISLPGQPGHVRISVTPRSAVFVKDAKPVAPIAPLPALLPVPLPSRPLPAPGPRPPAPPAPAPESESDEGDYDFLPNDPDLYPATHPSLVNDCLRMMDGLGLVDDDDLDDLYWY
jgi:hypothetical protein